jgi:hypothetical protein
MSFFEIPILKVVPEAMSFFVNFYCEVTTSTTTTEAAALSPNMSF